MAMTEPDPRYDAAERGRWRHAHRAALEAAAHDELGVGLGSLVTLPARPPKGPHEMSAAAMKFARMSAVAGWEGEARYSRGHAVSTRGEVLSPVEACSVRLRKRLPDGVVLRAAAVWQRRPGASWKTDGAYWWREGELPKAMGVEMVQNLVKSDGMCADVEAKSVRRTEIAEGDASRYAGICSECAAGRHCLKCTCCKGA